MTPRPVSDFPKAVLCVLGFLVAGGMFALFL
jgi:hypothetical protein